MKAIIRRYRDMGIATKQFIFLFVVTFGLIFALAYNNLHDAEELFRDQVIKDSQLLIERTNQTVDAYLDNVQNIMLLLSTRADLMEPGGEAEAIRTLQNYAGYNSSVARTLYLIREDGTVLSNTQVNYDIMGNPHLEQLVKLAMANYGAMNVSEPYHSPLSFKTVAYVMPVIGKEGGRPLGIVAVEVDLERLTNRIAPLLVNENQTFTIITNKNNVISYSAPSDRLLPYEPGIFPPEIRRDFVVRLGELPVGVRTIDGRNGKLVVVKTSANRLGWSLISFIKEASFYQNVRKLYENYRDAGLIWLVVLLLCSLVMTRHFTKPVRTLVAKMDRVRDLTVMSGISIDRNDEIGRLAKSYNAMMERIHTLVMEMKGMEAKKKHLELGILQSQIAPHFLYNTLACISSLARQKRIDDVRETIRSLVGLLSFSFNRTSEYVTLEEELECLKRYVHIQQIRYGEQFELELLVAPQALSCRMLKLTLQPLVENSIFHGIVPTKVKGCIRVRGRIVQGMLKLYIVDDGLGMERERCQTLLEKRDKPASSGSFTGMGVMNVHERLLIHFGQPSGLTVRSCPGKGTVVRVTLPFQEWNAAPLEKDVS